MGDFSLKPFCTFCILYHVQLLIIGKHTCLKGNNKQQRYWKQTGTEMVPTNRIWQHLMKPIGMQARDSMLLLMAKMNGFQGRPSRRAHKTSH